MMGVIYLIISLFHMKKVLACTRVMLSLAFLFCLLPAPARAAFIDILPNHPLYDAVTDLQNDNIISGFDDGTFRPERLITRGELTKMIVNAFLPDYNIQDCISWHGQDPDTGLLSDILPTQWEAPYVCIAKEAGIIQGYSDRTFRSGQKVSFAEASKILTRSAQLVYDYYETGENWYEAYAHELDYQQAIPLSIDDFEQPLNRGEAAEIIYRLKNHITTKDSQSFYSLGLQPIIYYYIALGRADYEGEEINNQKQSYDLLLNPTDSLSSFFEENQNIRWAQPTAFEKTGDHVYQFHLQLVQKDLTEKRYRVTMEVRGGKVRPVGSTEITQEQVQVIPFDDQTSAEVQWEKGQETLFIRKNNTLTPIETRKGFGTVSSETFPVDFSDVVFSKGGSYISYRIPWYEGSTTKIYNIAQNQIVYESLTTGTYGFSSDEKKFFECQMYYSPGQISVYDLPSLNLRRELIPTENGAPESVVERCSYNESENALNYTSQKETGQTQSQWPTIFGKYDMAADTVVTTPTELYDDRVISFYYPAQYSMKRISWEEVAVYKITDPGNSSITIRQVPRKELDKSMPIKSNQRVVSISEQDYSVFIFTNLDQNPWFDQVVASAGYSVKNYNP